MNSDFVMVPVWVLRNNNLDSSDKLLYGIILSYSQKEGYWYASNSHLSEMMNCSSRTLQRYIRNLINNGLIDRKVIYKNNSYEVQSRELHIK